MLPTTITIDAQMMRAFERYERAEQNVARAYYTLNVHSFDGLTDDPVTALQNARRAADKEREDALQIMGWYVIRTMQGKR